MVGLRARSPRRVEGGVVVSGRCTTCNGGPRLPARFGGFETFLFFLFLTSLPPPSAISRRGMVGLRARLLRWVEGGVVISGHCTTCNGGSLLPARFGGLEMFLPFSCSFLYPLLRLFHDVEQWTLVSARFGGLEVVRSLLAIARRAMVGLCCPLASVGLGCSFPPFFSLPDFASLSTGMVHRAAYWTDAEGGGFGHLLYSGCFIHLV